MKKFFMVTAALLTMAMGLTSCSDDDEVNKVSVAFNAVPKVEGALSSSDLEGATVVFTDIRNQDAKSFVLDANGSANVSLEPGTYNISVDRTVQNAQGEDVVISMRMENISVNQNGQIISGYVNSLPASALGKDFIFSEVFFNGETNSGKMMHPDQYFVLFNPTNDTLYADGVSVAVTSHLSKSQKLSWYDSYYPDKVPVRGFVTIPGSGKEHAVAPGEKLVVAFTAIDHSSVEGYDHAVNLTGADFEIYNGPEAGDVDNPDVPNMFITQSFSFQPRGYLAPLMFRLENGEQATIDAFVAANTSTYTETVEATATTPASTVETILLSVPTASIIDGVQTSDVPMDVVTRVIPETVDRGKFLVSGCHRQELCIRKTIMVGNKTYYQDTNDSSEDMVMQKGQNAYPTGWRN